jgi:hypothetical protein
MSNPILLKRGTKANLPTLSVAEPAFTTDTEELFVGSDSGNIGLAKQVDLENAISNSNVKNGISGTFTTVDSKTITVVDGLITSIV